MSAEIRSNVDSILALEGVVFSSVYVGERNKPQAEGKPWQWQCDAYMCTLTKGKQVADFEFFMGLGNRETVRGFKACKLPGAVHINGNWQASKPKHPQAADVLYSVILDSSACEQSFADWCSDFGYDEDSRKAFATYEACQQNFDKLRRVIPRATIEALREALQDY